MLKFTEEGHRYESIDQSNPIQWLGVTTLISFLHDGFDKEARAKSCSTKKPTEKFPNKWFGFAPQVILDAWDEENRRAVTLGHWYHNKREQLLYYEPGCVLPIIQDGQKIAPNQKLADGIYPEHLVYLASAGICGQSDLVTVADGLVSIRDYKTSKEINRRSYVHWETGPKKMLHPIKNIEDCHYQHYALQLSLYMYIILRHNPQLKPGTLTIEHVKFESDGENKWGYPITALDDMGEPIVKEVEMIEVPYLKNEVVKVLEWLKENKSKLIKTY